MNSTTDILQTLSDIFFIVKWGGIGMIVIQLVTLYCVWRKAKRG